MRSTQTCGLEPNPFPWIPITWPASTEVVVLKMKGAAKTCIALLSRPRSRGTARGVTVFAFQFEKAQTEYFVRDRSRFIGRAWSVVRGVQKILSRERMGVTQRLAPGVIERN